MSVLLAALPSHGFRAQIVHRFADCHASRDLARGLTRRDHDRRGFGGAFFPVVLAAFVCGHENRLKIDPNAGTRR